MHDYANMSIDAFRALPNYDLHYWDAVNMWLNAKHRLAAVKDEELSLRMLLAGATFAAPAEGTTHHKFINGAKMTIKQLINRKIDPAAINACLTDLREVIGDKADDIIRWKPEIAVAEYKKLTDEQRALLAPAVTSSPGTPQLEFTKASN